MPSIEKEPIYDAYCIDRRQYQRFLNILLGDVLVVQLVASMSGVVLSGVVMVVRISLEAKYLQHLSAQLIHNITVYIYLPKVLTGLLHFINFLQDVK